MADQRIVAITRVTGSRARACPYGSLVSVSPGSQGEPKIAATV